MILTLYKTDKTKCKDSVKHSLDNAITYQTLISLLVLKARGPWVTLWTVPCIKSDLIILHTEWNEFKLLNFKKLVRKKNFIVYDLRNLYSPSNMKKNKIKYFGVGR